jgi:hypothetical protein
VESLEQVRHLIGDSRPRDMQRGAQPASS